MNLRRQLLLVSLLTLVLPWAGCQFIRETESALREGQQQMLSGTALAIADSLSQFPDEFAVTEVTDRSGELYGHPLASTPLIDGYFDDWSIPPESLRTMRGVDGQISFAIGILGQHAYLYVDVRDNDVVYAGPGANVVAEGIFSDRVVLVTGNETEITSLFDFVSEAPGSLVAINRTGAQRFAEPRILAHWEDTATGYQLEA